MLCATILTLSFVSAANVYSEESYIVDTSPTLQDCAINTANAQEDTKFYWEGTDENLVEYLNRYNIHVDLTKLDSMNVTQEMLSGDMIP